MATDPAGEGDLDSLVRRVDPDRWLATRFITDAGQRADVIALYAFDHELARARQVASNPLIAEIRLTWWREALEEIFGGATERAHPAARALAIAVRRHSLPREPLESMIAGRIDALNASGPDAAAAFRLAGGSAAVGAASILGDARLAEAARPAGELWAQTRTANDKADLAPSELRDRINIASRTARRLQAQAFPAVAHVALLRGYSPGRTLSPISTRVRLVTAVLTGSI